MRILIIGDDKRAEELQGRLKGGHDILHKAVLDDVSHALKEFDVIFHLYLDEKPEDIIALKGLKNKPIIAGAAKKSLAAMVHQHGGAIDCHLAGMNTLPTFIDRENAEVSFYNEASRFAAQDFFKKINWEYLVVKDRTGMVTPSIIFMIINEACYTVQEGTSSMEDIDTGMKLGTNYPYGPFEWADKIGIRHIYETLDAIYQDTHDERYKICPLLKTKYLKNEPFYKR